MLSVELIDFWPYVNSHKRVSHLGPGRGPSDCAVLACGGGGLVEGGDVSMGWEEGEGVEVVEEDEGGGGAAQAGAVALEGVAGWVDEFAGRAWKRHTTEGLFVTEVTLVTAQTFKTTYYLYSLDDITEIPQQVLRKYEPQPRLTLHRLVHINVHIHRTIALKR